MIIISYDISDNKLRAKFVKYLKRFGHRIQYSVFEIDTSERMLNIIESDLKNIFEKQFMETNSVLLFRLSNTCKITRYGYATSDTKDLIIIK